MSVKTVMRMGNPVLRNENIEFSEEEILNLETKVLVSDMLDTMYEKGGIGIAAPQIGVNKRVVVVGHGESSERYLLGCTRRC